MIFTVKKAEAIYTGGGVYIYGGITESGQHFIASDEYDWVMLTDKQTMSDELPEEEWDDLWYSEWQEANMTYETTSEEEGKEWILAIYNWIIQNHPNGNYDMGEIEYRRGCLVGELEDMENAWKGYRMTNSELIQYHAICSGWLLNSNSEDAIEEYRRVQDELLRRMEDFVDEPRRM